MPRPSLSATLAKAAGVVVSKAAAAGGTAALPRQAPIAQAEAAALEASMSLQAGHVADPLDGVPAIAAFAGCIAIAVGAKASPTRASATVRIRTTACRR